MIRNLSVFLFLLSICQGYVFAEDSGEIIWDRKIALGYNVASGNTDSSQLSTDLFINRKIEKINETTFKGNIYYSATNDVMDTQKWYGMGRYAFSFGEEKTWYIFYKIETDHDKFAGIDYRLIPSTGIGCWISNVSDFKALIEGGIGFEHTKYNNGTAGNNEALLATRVFLEKMLWEKSKVVEDIYCYNTLGDLGEYRIHSETLFSNPVNENLTLGINLIIDYNSEPPGDIKKTDVRLMTSLAYSF